MKKVFQLTAKVDAPVSLARWVGECIRQRVHDVPVGLTPWAPINVSQIKRPSGAFGTSTQSRLTQSGHAARVKKWGSEQLVR